MYLDAIYMQGDPLPKYTKEEIHIHLKSGMSPIAIKGRQTTRVHSEESGRIITEAQAMGLIQGIRDL